MTKVHVIKHYTLNTLTGRHALLRKGVGKAYVFEESEVLLDP